MTPGFGRARLVVTIVALCTYAIVTNCAAQDVAPIDTMSEAVRLRDAKDFAGASSILRTYLDHHPDNGDAARMLVETLYWQKDVAGARDVAESSLAKHPEDTTLRLVFGRMLVETGDGRRARKVLEPVLGAASRGRADALIGERAYWDGDYSEAKRQFAAALRADSAQPDVRRQLGEILVATAPWIRLSPTAQHDDQPIDAVGGTVEGGVFVTPLTTISFRAAPTFFRLTDSATRTVTTEEVAVGTYFAPVRTELEVAGGGLQRSFGSSSDWTGHAGLGFRLPSGFALRARVERAPYLYTEASLSRPVMTSTGTATLDWASAQGWLGRAAAQQQRFPDANKINTGYAWLLAPIVHTSGVQFQIGYAFTAQNADENRFELANPSQPYSPSDPRFDFSGRYDPYYTPINLIEHSAIAAMMVRVAPAVTFRANGGYGVHATDDETEFAAGPGISNEIISKVSQQTFSPWNAGASIEGITSSGVTLGLSGDIMHTSFYTVASLRAQLTYRFGIPARRAAAGY